MTTKPSLFSQFRDGARFRFRIEPRMEQPGWLGLIVSLGAVTLALVLGGIVLILRGRGPHPSIRFHGQGRIR